MSETCPKCGAGYAVRTYSYTCGSWESAADMFNQSDKCRIAELTAALATERQRADALCEAAESLIDSEPCHYDHNDFCQEHYCGRPCKNEVARQAVAEYKGATQ